MKKNFILVIIFLFLYYAVCFADTVRWKISSDGLFLGDVFQGQRNKDSDNWIQGIWENPGKCTSSTPSYFCLNSKYYEFLPDGTFKYWEAGGGEHCAPEKFNKGSKGDRQNNQNIQKKTGRYKIIDDRTVELSATWEIEDNSIAACSQRCMADEDCAVVLLPELFGPGGCSPPCGNVYNVKPAALNRYYSGLYLEMLKEEEEGKRNFNCNECEGNPPDIRPISHYQAICQNSRCVLK